MPKVVYEAVALLPFYPVIGFILNHLSFSDLSRWRYQMNKSFCYSLTSEYLATQSRYFEYDVISGTHAITTKHISHV